MKQFIKKIAIFCIPIILFAIILEIVIESIPNSYSYKHLYMNRNASHIKTIVLGSSNAYDGIDASILPNGFNMANSGQALREDYLLLDKHIDFLDSLQTVILGLGYHSFKSSQTTQRRLYYTIYMHIYSRWPLSRYSFEMYDMQQAVRKFAEYIKTRDITRCDTYGQRLFYEGIYDKDGNRDMQITFLSNLDSYFPKDKKIEIDSCITYLHKIDSLCQANSIRLVIVQMPVLSQYKEKLPLEQIAIQDSILRSFTASALYIDASEWPLTMGDCYNATHISKTASTPFTNYLFEKIYQ